MISISPWLNDKYSPIHQSDMPGHHATSLLSNQHLVMRSLKFLRITWVIWVIRWFVLRILCQNISKQWCKLMGHESARFQHDTHSVFITWFKHGPQMASRMICRYGPYDPLVGFTTEDHQMGMSESGVYTKIAMLMWMMINQWLTND